LQRIVCLVVMLYRVNEPSTQRPWAGRTTAPKQLPQPQTRACGLWTTKCRGERSSGEPTAHPRRCEPGTAL